MRLPDPLAEDIDSSRARITVAGRRAHLVVRAARWGRRCHQFCSEPWTLCNSRDLAVTLKLVPNIALTLPLTLTLDSTLTLTLMAQGVRCPEGLTASGDMAQVVAASEIVLMVIPTPFVAATVAPLAQLLRPDQILVSCTKGILNDTLETPNEACS